jgi:hypothetical protein
MGCRGRDGLDGVGSEADSMASSSVTSERWKMMATLTSGPRMAATRREEKGVRLRPVDCWAGPLRLAGC